MSKQEVTTVGNLGFSKNGLPLEVKYCTKCVESNQRFIGSAPHSDQKSSQKDHIIFDDEGVCSACRYFEYKRTINWQEREEELLELLARHRRTDGSYDVLVPGSGGKDSRYTAHILKHKYNMNPLTVTWAPHIYTDIGWRNLISWIHSGLDNILYTPNGQVHSTLTRLAFENLLHPFQPFVLGQYNVAPRVAMEKDIKLIFYGDFYPEKGIGSDVDFTQKSFDTRLFTRTEKQDLYLSGVHINDLPRHGITTRDLHPYLPLEVNRLSESGIEMHFLPYYLNYDPQRAYYYSTEHTGFEVNPDGRTEGTYTKYCSLDDKVDGFHFFTWFIKTGRGRATEDAALEIRNGHLTREEGVALVQRYDGEFPQKYFQDFLKYVSLDESRFWEIIDSFRPEHIWKREGNEWKLRQQVS
ncbi:N-acetyl sugar amidotransferase [Desulfovibrio ferrophilus]|uniref:N-acetyl sugar amidotransferase n=1 Tax=Desulfovibrio ferrophilus TaxID=241368 RepID=A0A2Z6B1P3_9BACT|nr:N-acetyl sugar amidotransferase [Desulfovibrio ferrophilus]BBD09316.1 N-acetyl sugar amidotransferase [Desulfovibrio ferrophilus]